MRIQRVSGSLVYILYIFFLTVTACEEQENKTGSGGYHVEVKGIGIDCGIWLVKFYDEQERISIEENYPNAYYPVYYAQNLGEEYKVPGLKLLVLLNKEAVTPALCTTLGPGYSHVYIESASIDQEAR